MKKALQAKPLSTERTVSQVVEGMHKDFRQNGYYRAEDVRHVFGDPGRSVEVRLTDKSSFASRKS